MIFDVAGEHRGRVFAFEFRKQVLRHLAERIDEYIQAPAVRHANHEFLHAGRTCALQQVVEHRNEAVATFQRKTRLADVARMQVTFECFCCRDALKNVLLVTDVVARRRTDAFHALLKPALLRNVAHIHELVTDRPAIGVLQESQKIGEFHFARPDQ